MTENRKSRFNKNIMRKSTIENKLFVLFFFQDQESKKNVGNVTVIFVKFQKIRQSKSMGERDER